MTKALFGAAFFSALATAQAQLTWESKEIELHPKYGDAEAVANFKYENKGDKPIQIKNVRSSCGCTVASLKKNDVAPGEKGEVTATFKIGGRTGLQQKTVTVETDEAEQAETTLLLKATITAPVEVQPTFVSWKNGETPEPKKITVKAAKDVKISKVDVTSNSPAFTTKVEKGSGPGEFVINVKPTDTGKAGFATLTINPDYPIKLTANASVIGLAPGVR